MPKAKLHIKVCGMRDPQNIQEVSSLGIDYMGFIFYPLSKRYVEQIDFIDNTSPIKRTGVFVNSTVKQINETIAKFKLEAVQLHGDEDADFCQALRSSTVKLIKAFGIDDQFNWNDVVPYLDVVDLFLFDTKSNDYGGTGKTFNWAKLKDYPYDIPYFLSGGLALDNIEEVKHFTDERLYGVDLNSKFEIVPGLKDIEKLKHALTILRNE